MAPRVGVHIRHSRLDAPEAFLTTGEPTVALRENGFARRAFEQGEEADADAKLRFGRRFLFGEMRQALEQGEFSLGSKHVEIALLSAFAAGGAFGDPGVFDKAAEEGIDEVVVHVPMAGHETGEFFEGIAMPRAFHEGREKD